MPVPLGWPRERPAALGPARRGRRAASGRPAPCRRCAGPGGARPRGGRDLGAGRGRADGPPRARGLRGRRWCSARSASPALPASPSTRPVGRRSCWPGDRRDRPARRWQRAVAVAGAGWRARTAGHGAVQHQEPRLARRAGRRDGREPGLEVAVWDEKRLAARASAASWASARPRRRPPRLIRLDYSPAARAARAHADGGAGRQGHHLRHRRAVDQARPRRMATMKRDMTGGAVVLAVMAALAAVGCPVRVIGLVAGRRERRLRQRAAPRRRGAPLRRPHHRGHQHRRRGPAGDGRRPRLRRRRARPRRDRRRRHPHRRDEGRARASSIGGYFANDDALAARLLAAGGAVRRAVVADAAGRRLRGEDRLQASPTPTTPAGGPGAITAALFLQHFAGDVPWAHLDIASVGDVAGDAHEWTKGPTGFGARALLAWLGCADPLAGVGEDGSARDGLTVRWSLADAPDGVEDELATYVATTSHARFTGMAGLRVQDLADAAGGVVRGLLRLRRRRGPRGVPGDLHRRRRRRAGVADRRQRAGPDRGLRGGRGRRGLGGLPPSARAGA